MSGCQYGDTWKECVPELCDQLDLDGLLKCCDTCSDILDDAPEIVPPPLGGLATTTTTTFSPASSTWRATRRSSVYYQSTSGKDSTKATDLRPSTLRPSIPPLVNTPGMATSRARIYIRSTDLDMYYLELSPNHSSGCNYCLILAFENNYQVWKTQTGSYSYDGDYIGLDLDNLCRRMLFRNCLASIHHVSQFMQCARIRPPGVPVILARTAIQHMIYAVKHAKISTQECQVHLCHWRWTISHTLTAHTII